MAVLTKDHSAAQAEAEECLAAAEAQRVEAVSSLEAMAGERDNLEANLATAMEELRVNLGAIAAAEAHESTEQLLVAAAEGATAQRLRDVEDKVVLAQSATEAASQLSLVHESAKEETEAKLAAAIVLLESLQEKAGLAESLQEQVEAMQTELDAAQGIRNDEFCV